MANAVEVAVLYKTAASKWSPSFDNSKAGVDKVRVFLFASLRKYFSKRETCSYFFLKFFLGRYVGLWSCRSNLGASKSEVISIIEEPLRTKHKPENNVFFLKCRYEGINLQNWTNFSNYLSFYYDKLDHNINDLNLQNYVLCIVESFQSNGLTSNLLSANFSSSLLSTRKYFAYHKHPFRGQFLKAEIGRETFPEELLNVEAYNSIFTAN